MVLAARTERRLAEVAKEVTELGRRAVTVPTDITDDARRPAWSTTSLEAFGRVDALVNNAFAMPPMRTWRTTFDHLRDGFETNGSPRCA